MAGFEALECGKHFLSETMIALLKQIGTPYLHGKMLWSNLPKEIWNAFKNKEKN